MHKVQKWLGQEHEEAHKTKTHFQISVQEVQKYTLRTQKNSLEEENKSSQ